MKRSGFKNKATTQLKRSPLKKVSKNKVKKKKPSITTLKNKLWEHVKTFIRERDGNKCYTCPATGLVGSNWHTSHFIPSAACGALLRFHPHNLASCCYNCNINLGGNGSEFYRRLVRDKGQQFIDSIFILKGKSIKADIIFYQNMIDLYSVGNEEGIINYLNSL